MNYDNPDGTYAFAGILKRSYAYVRQMKLDYTLMDRGRDTTVAYYQQI